MDESLQIGNPAEWERFVTSHARFTDEVPKIIDLANKVFNRRLEESSQEKIVIFWLGILCMDDFEDLFILVANGRGFGGQKILRGMYERVVTLAYLQAHKEEIPLFVAFEKIRYFKIAKELEAVLGEDAMKHVRRVTQEQRDEVRTQFMRRCTCHKKCEVEVEAFSWSPMGMPQLADKAGHDLRRDLVNSYYMPMTETHPTVFAATARQEVTATGTSFRVSQERAHAAGDRALAMAYKHVLQVLDIQIDCFPELAPLAGEMKALVDTHNEIAVEASPSLRTD